MFEYVRNCQRWHRRPTWQCGLQKRLQLTEVREREGRVGPELRAVTGRVFEEVLEESVQGISIEGLQADQVKEQIQGRVLVQHGVGPVRFVSCAEEGMGKVHVWKTDAVTWCGRRWVHVRGRRCLRAVAVGVSGGAVQVLGP